MYLTGIIRNAAFVRIRCFYLQSYTHVDKRVGEFDTLKKKQQRGFSQIKIRLSLCVCVKAHAHEWTYMCLVKRKSS